MQLIRRNPDMNLLLLFSVLAFSHIVLGNTEKVIFLGPSNITVPTQSPTIEDLQLHALSPRHWSLRTRLPAEFPSPKSEQGVASWFLLHGLKEGQRYEVRVCWAATNPTAFLLDTYELQTVFETPELIGSLAEYAESRQKEQSDGLVPPEKLEQPRYENPSSMLFLRIFAAADYYTMNRTLMEQVQPILVDVILDPFLFNVFPRSLIPTAAYIVILAVGAWHLSKYVSNTVQSFSQDLHRLEKRKD